MLWVKAFHIMAMVAWFSGLFYLPRLFVYHSLSYDTIGQERFKVMERKLYYNITTPSMLFTLLSGAWLLVKEPEHFHLLWFHVKLACVAGLISYHLYCGYLVKIFQENRNTRSHIFYRIFNEIPALFLAAIVILVIIKPF